MLFKVLAEVANDAGFDITHLFVYLLGEVHQVFLQLGHPWHLLRL